MFADSVSLDRRTLLWCEPDERIALIVDRRRRQFDLLTRFGDASGDVFETRYREFDIIENQDGFVSVGEVHENFGLGQDLTVIGCGRDIDNGIGISQSISSRGADVQSEPDQNETDGDSDADDQAFDGDEPSGRPAVRERL